MRRDKLGLLTLFVVLSVAMISCAQSAPAGTSGKAAPKQLVVGMPYDIGKTDPNFSIGRGDWSLSSNVFESLVSIDKDGNIVPALATSWKLGADGMSYEFTLRSGVRFQNGDPFTADDVKYSLERIIDPKSPKGIGYGSMKPIDHVEVVSPTQVVVRLKDPDPTLLSSLFPTGMIVPAGYVSKVGNDEFAKKPIGTGPYKFVSWEKLKSYKIEAWDGYWGKAPALSSVEFRVIPEESTRVAALQAGEIDMAAELPPSQVATIKSTSGLKVVSTPSSMITRVMLKQTRGAFEPFLDKRVRLAMAMALDRDAMIKQLLQGWAQPVASLVPPGIIGWDKELKPYPYDVAKAKQLMAEAGFGGGFKTQMVMQPEFREIDESLVSYWKQIGITVDLVPMEKAAALGALGGGTQLPLATWTSGDYTGDPQGRLMSFLHSKGANSYYSNPDVDKLLETAIKTPDPAAARGKYQELFKKVYDETAYIPLWSPLAVWGMKEKVDWQPTGQFGAVPVLWSTRWSN